MIPRTSLLKIPLLFVLCFLSPVAADDAADNHSIDNLRMQLQDDPDNHGLRYQLARTYNFSGQYAKAIQLFNELLEVNAENADYLLGIGQAYLWSERAERGLPYLEKAVEIAPDYEDAYRTLGMAYVQADQSTKAELLYRDARQRFENPAWASPDTTSLADEDFPGFTLYLGNHSEDLDYNPDNWRRTRLALTTHLDENRQVSIYGEDSEHFNLDDKIYGISTAFPLFDRTYAFTDISISPTHHFTYKYSLYGKIGHSFSDGWGVLGGIRHRVYSGATVNILDATVEKYISDYRLAYTLFFSDSDTAGNAMSHRIQAGYYFSNRNSVQIAVTAGEEVDKIVAANRIIRTEFTNISLWGEFWLDSNFSIQYGVGYTDLALPVQGDSHRKHIQLGINYHF